ncbi:MAG: transcription-repair coupling factor, partial [Candidatus Omnitrophica bacterium CG12_big_fil_rev_8_21_14_0_65_50_5]
ELFVGQSLDFQHLAKKLVEFGYTRLSKAAKEGEFAQQGATLDVFPANFETPIRVSLDDRSIEAIFNFDPLSGQIITQHKIVIILPYKRSRISMDIFNADTPIEGFVDIEAGDYVVHNQHGIGKYLGIEKIFRNKESADHLVIEYDGGDKLFVPKHDIRLVQKYVSFYKRPPRLYRLGSKEWQRTKLAIQQKLERVAAELLRIQALRASLQGHAFKADPELEKEFAVKFPFEETPDQAKAIEAVIKDMESTQPMDRLICADVGYGKTEVALRAAFKAALDGKQAAVLVPTTILAEQHFYNFKKRFSEFPVTIQMLSRFRSPQEQKAIVADLREGKVDIIIGTHRLLSKDVGFKDLGLIIIDEEQRFGVKAKEKLKHFRLLADVLTLTATPIPRTLHMALTGARDMSVIMTPPSRRLSIHTRVIDFDEEVLQEAIRLELERQGQVFFLHNRVEDIERMGTIVTDLAPEAR